MVVVPRSLLRQAPPGPLILQNHKLYGIVGPSMTIALRACKVIKRKIEQAGLALSSPIVDPSKMPGHVLVVQSSLVLEPNAISLGLTAAVIGIMIGCRIKPLVAFFGLVYGSYCKVCGCGSWRRRPAWYMH